ncbi:LysR family transcriptional regulator [bacterium]|nr:LysR family transcriptional regulator [bacterium]
MTFTQLEYVLALVEYGHFGKAAEACGVTQPTLSAQIQKLEEEWGVKLFVRNAHPIGLSEAGVQLLERIRNVQKEVKTLEMGVEELHGHFKGGFRLGIIPTLSPALLPRMLPGLQKSLPAAHFFLSEHTTDALIGALKERRIDAALLAGPIEERGLREVPLFYEPFVAYVPESHPLHAEPFLLHSQLKTADVLVLNEGHCFRNSVLRLCGEPREPNRFMPKVHLDTGSFSALIRLANLGYGMTLLPWLTAAELSKEDQKSIKPLDRPTPTREISLVYPEDQHKRAVLNALSETVRLSVPERMWSEKNWVLSAR